MIHNSLSPGCKMFMFREDDVTTPTEKRLRISGQPDNVNYGRQLVMYLLASRDHTDDNEGKYSPMPNCRGPISQGV